MSYARVFLRGWSRREWLTVFVVAITAAFLLGTALLLASAGAYTETLEDDLSGTATATEYDSLAEARAAADSQAVIVPLATAEVQGTSVTVAGIPADAPTVLSGASVDWREARFPDVSAGAVGPVSEPNTVRFVGESGTVEATVRPATTERGESDTLLPPWWYATGPETVEELGVTSVIVFDPSGGVGGAVPTGRAAPPGVPLIAALPFLLAGIRQLLTVLSIAALGGGLLVSVVVYSVSRMAIRDRYDDIRVVRATGGAPAKLFAVLCARATTLVVAGVALGYALGVVFTNAITNLAIVAGLPVSLSGTVTPAVARLLLLLSSILVLAGVVAGALAAWPAIRTPPARLRSGGPTATRVDALTARWLSDSKRTDGGNASRQRDSDGRLGTRLLGWARPDLLDARAAIPTTATLTVFVFIVLLVGSLWGAFVPLSSTQSGTIVEAGAAHPLNSRVDADSAELLRSQGINASAEVIYAAVSDGEPFLVRGADYDHFASVSKARLVAGRAPESADEAVIGAELARTLDVGVGDTLLLGGSVTPGVRRVTIVGRYTSTETLDDLLVVPLEATQGLATGPGQVHIVRTEDLSAAQQALIADSATANRSGVVVTGVTAPSSVARGDTFDVSVSLRNLDERARETSVVVRAGSDVVGRTTVTVDPGATREVTVPVSLTDTGSKTLNVDGYTASIEVLDPTQLSIPAELPDRAPPGARLIVPAESVNGSLVSNATVDVDGESFRTGSQGVAIVRLPDEPGTYDLRVRKAGFSGSSSTIRIQEAATRELSARLRVRPETGNALTSPRIEVQVANPWDRTLTRNLTLLSREERVTRTVELAAGETTRVNVTASEIGFEERLPPGAYEIRLVSETASTTELATATYRVTGDERVLSVIASRGSYAPGTPVGQAIENVFGNVQVLFGAIVLLAGGATIGGTTAAFAQAVHARGRTIGIRRATGATDRQLLLALGADACRIAIPSTLLAVVGALAAMTLFEQSGLLVLFGIRLSIPTAPWVFGLVLVGGVVLSVTSVVLGAIGFLRVPPARLLRLRE